MALIKNLQDTQNKKELIKLIAMELENFFKFAFAQQWVEFFF